MADPRSRRRADVTATERQARAIEADVADARSRLRALRSIDPVGSEARALEARVAELEEARLSALQQARDARLEAGTTSTEPMKVEDLDRDLPLLLLPVRLETRFFRKPNNKWELRVRVYPDDIHVDSHEPELTSSEVEWGAALLEAGLEVGERRVADQRGLAAARGTVRRSAGRLDCSLAHARRV